MAAMYSGIQLKLKSPHTPWEEKLKLARFAWMSTQCLLPNKEQVLLDWCTHALTGWYSRKVDFSHGVLEGLWHYLDDLLHSKKLHLLLKQGKTISLRLNMAQLLLERLSEDAHVGSRSPVCLSTILSVCQGLFSSPALLSVFTTKYELMVTLVAALCSLSCHELEQHVDAGERPSQPKQSPHSVSVFDILLQALSCYLSVQRQQANPNRVFSMVTNQLLQKLVLLRHLLTPGEFGPCHTSLPLHQQLCRDIRVKIDSILKSSLFPPDHLIPYKEELLPSKSDAVRRPGGAKGPFKPVHTILSRLGAQDYCAAPLRYTVASATLSLLFKFFLESYRSSRGQREEEHSMLCFRFLTKLVSVLDVGLDGDSFAPVKADEATPLRSGGSSAPVSPDSWSLALLAVESLLNQALSAEIYNVAADRIRHGEVQLKFYQCVGQMLLNQAHPSIPAWYRCLKALLSLNHLILEPDLDQLLSSAWVHSECSEAPVQKAREHLVCSLLQIYTKLRQLPRLFSEILSVVCQPALEHLRPPLLSEEIFSSLRTCLLDIPPSQGLEICSLVLETIGKYLLPDLRKEDMELDGESGDGGMRNDRDKGAASLKLFSLSQLLHVVLFNLKTLDNASPLPVVRQSQSLMKSMQQLVRELMLVLPLQLSRAARSILAGTELLAGLDEDQAWDGQVASVNPGSYPVAHWYLVVSNLPLIAPHLSGGDVGRVADALVGSLRGRKRRKEKECLPGHLTTSLVFSQLLQSSVHAELPALFSATVRALNQGIVSTLREAGVSEVVPTLFEVLEEEGECSEAVSSQPRSSLFEKEALVREILASVETGKVAALLTAEQTEELLDLLSIATHLNPDGMNSEDISSSFLLLLFVLVSTSAAPESEADAAVLVKLLRVLTCLVEGRTFPSLFKHIHGATLLQAVAAALFRRSSSSGRFETTGWLDVISASRDLITSLVRLIINRNSSVRLNLDQFTCYLTGQGVAGGPAVSSGSAHTSEAELGRSRSSDHLLLAVLASFSQEMVSNLGRSKSMDQTLAQMLIRTTASLGQAVKIVLKPKTGGQSGKQPASMLSQAFLVEVVTIMLRCELSSSSSAEPESRQADMELSHMDLYQGFCQQILKEICSAQRPMDFLVSSLHFLSSFYQVLKKTGRNVEHQEEKMKREKESDELYARILQTVHRLMSASWLTPADLCDLEAAVQALLHHLLEESSPEQLGLLLLLIREAFQASQLRAGGYRDVLSVVTIIKLLSCCQLPESCSKAFWLLTPQIISSLSLFVRWASEDPALTLPFTVPAVTCLTSLLRQGEGLLTSPHHVTLVLGALQTVPLDRLSPPVYRSTFLALHEALFAIIQCHPQVMLKAAPSFLNVFYRLVASIMQEGRQRGESHTGPDGDVLLECSRLVERMYSHIAAVAESFTTLSSFIVAQYVTELQKVTLCADIKMHLTEGIYRILDLCVGQDIKFLTAGLQTGVREVFGELYSSYSLYHKAQRQGEDKYTV
ncbi:unnamed protein product, partial [Tetraodon nigroviridis]